MSTKKPHTNQIKKFLEKYFNKISIPFLQFKDKSGSDTVTNKSSMDSLPTVKKTSNEKTYDIKSVLQGEIKPSSVLSINNLLVSPTKIDSILTSKPAKNINNIMLNTFRQPERANYSAKFEPTAKKAGGSEPTKVTLLRDRSSIGPKEAALVGEEGPEQIIESTASVIPLVKEKTKKVTELQRLVPNLSKTEIKQPRIDNHKIHSALTVKNLEQSKTYSQSSQAFNPNLSNTVSFSPKIKTSLKTEAITPFALLSNIKEKEPKVVAGKQQTPVNMSSQDRRQLFLLAQNKQITNVIEKQSDGTQILQLPAYAEGKNTEVITKQNISSIQDKSNYENSKIQTISSNKVQAKDQVQAITPLINKDTQSSLPKIEAKKETKNLDVFDNFKQTFMSMFGTKNKQEQTKQNNEMETPTSLDQSTMNNVNVSDNRSFNNPTTVVNTFNYDSFRKTSDYMQMIPEWRMRVG